MTEPFIHRNSKSYRNNTLILMQAHGGMEEALIRNWSWLQMSGCDILITSPENDPVKSLQGPLLGKVIQAHPADYYRLQERALMAFEICLSQLRTQYDSLMLLHYDCVFLGPLPARIPGGLETFVYPNPYKQFSSNWKCCLPWWFSWEALEKFVIAARCRPIDYQQGCLDHWIPAICDESGIIPTHTNLISYECNSLDHGPERERARRSILAGCPFVHGVKHEQDLKWVLDEAKLPTFNPLGFWEAEHQRNESHCYGKEESYRKAAELLSECVTIEDWGCGSGYARRFFNDGYRGIDGSRSKFCDEVDDLRTRESKPEGILLRHVLEHNLEWATLLKNALRCAQKRLVIVFFMDWVDQTTVQWEECGRPCITLSRNDVLETVKPLVPVESEAGGEIIWTLGK